jgi:putative hemolysin
MRAAAEVVVVLLLILANGLFSGAETAVVSSRKARSSSGPTRARQAGRALALAEQPNVFLAPSRSGSP